jgi:hypothetical protein
VKFRDRADDRTIYTDLRGGRVVMSCLGHLRQQ